MDEGIRESSKLYFFFFSSTRFFSLARKILYEEIIMEGGDYF